MEQVELRVRRIHDGTEERVLRFPWKGGILGIQWVRSLALLARAKSGRLKASQALSRKFGRADPVIGSLSSAP